MDKVYQVFVSSTYSDLKDERRHVSETLAKAGYIPAGMELFPATDQQQLEFIKRIVERCDYYVVIVGGRYGSLADDKISFTEKEYDYAIQKKIPILAFLHARPDKIEAGKTDQDMEQARKLAAFRDKLSRGRIVDFWEAPHDLCTKVVIAIAQAINLSPGTGWVRGNQAADPLILQELERLRIDNEQLRQRLSELDGASLVFPDDLAGPEDTLEIAVYHNGNVVGERRISVKDLFREIFDMLVEQTSEFSIQQEIARPWAVENGKIKSYESCDYMIDNNEARIIRSHLEAMGLMQLTRQVHEYTSFDGRLHKDPYIAWSITEKGRRYMASMLALKRSQK